MEKNGLAGLIVGLILFIYNLVVYIFFMCQEKKEEMNLNSREFCREHVLKYRNILKKFNELSHKIKEIIIKCLDSIIDDIFIDVIKRLFFIATNDDDCYAP